MNLVQGCCEILLWRSHFFSIVDLMPLISALSYDTTLFCNLFVKSFTLWLLILRGDWNIFPWIRHIQIDLTKVVELVHFRPILEGKVKTFMLQCWIWCYKGSKNLDGPVFSSWLLYLRPGHPTQTVSGDIFQNKNTPIWVFYFWDWTIDNL